MTQKEFKEAMLRGLGRCVVALRQEPEKYRDIVLWACGRDIAYDAQSEGTRSWYVYAMASCYPDKETFIAAASEALKKYRSNRGWDLLHLSEVLSFFAKDGYESAQKALDDKYREILGAMFARKRRPEGVFSELEDLEQLGLVLTIDRKSFLRIAGDFGRLYREKKYMHDGDFAWFFSSKGEQYRKTMYAAAKKDEDIACFMNREQAYIDASVEKTEKRKSDPARYLSGAALSRWLAKQVDKETVERYAQAYREEAEPLKRAKALAAFSHCPYPGDPRTIIGDTRSEEPQLQREAWRALENIRHPAVRAFALENAKKGVRSLENFALLVTNYTPKNGPLLESLLRKWIEEKDWDSIHSAGMDIYRAFYKNSGIPHPKHLLPLLYEHNPCSFCRGSALEYMARHRMLTEEILRECLTDSDEDNRSFAARKLKR